MEYLLPFATVAVIHFLAVASPGPDFAIVVKNSLLHSRRAGTITAIGVGLGILIHVAYSLMGIGLLISQSVMLFNAFKFAAAGYLIYIGIKSLRATPNTTKDDVHGRKTQMSDKRAFKEGFITNALNPKATLFFLSLFTAVIDPTTPLAIQFGYGLYMAFATGIWFCLVARVFSHSKLCDKLHKSQHIIERTTGGILILLGLKVATSKL